jgi:glycosyltransferase involved in cell wall biosynthesis
VVDDGSIDNTKEVVDSFKDPRIIYIYHENLGVSATRNTGIKASRGEYIALLDSDDMWLPQNLELKLKVLDSHPDLALVCSDGYAFDDQTGKIIGRGWHDKRTDSLVDPKKAARYALKYLLSRGCFLAPQSSLVRRTAIIHVGYFDESLKTQEDWDLFVRIVQCFPIDIIDIPLVMIRKHGVSLQSNNEQMYKDALAVIYKLLRSYSLSKAHLRLVKRRLARTHLRYGWDMVVSGKTAIGREKLFTSIKINPWGIKPYIYLAFSLLGNGPTQTLKSWKKWLQRHF